MRIKNASCKICRCCLCLLDFAIAAHAQCAAAAYRSTLLFRAQTNCCCPAYARRHPQTSSADFKSLCPSQRWPRQCNQDSSQYTLSGRILISSPWAL
ncbi:hypothetical protein BDZ97DRAFT_1840109 [Flammula alnicola]|nr:hypothetical protein BDZ97DRAFT_1840109 [Flammula alnicola]